MSLKSRTFVLFAFVIIFNLVAWGAFFYLVKLNPILSSLGLLAYFFGLKHAFDADHIAAIDNVTRKLRQDNQKPVGVGLFFSLRSFNSCDFAVFWLNNSCKDNPDAYGFFEKLRKYFWNCSFSVVFNNYWDFKSACRKKSL
ncbi:MAG: hypothetical protein ACPLW6_05615 [Desulfurella sp.]|uniref:HoxN/HupN/NixA family nickel/cobalt transporter n=1 Tax=Desulfurella sp. TaxID=1962857 RepID=UPI003C71027A